MKKQKRDEKKEKKHKRIRRDKKRERSKAKAKKLNIYIITVPLVKSLVRGCTSWSKTIATPLIPAVKASAKALSMGSFPKSASIVHWLFAWAITEENGLQKGNESYHLIKKEITNKIYNGKKLINPQNKYKQGIREMK